MSRLIAVLGVVVSTLGCSDPLWPSEVGGTYVYAPVGGLERQLSIDGSLQPYTLMIHDTLTLRADGTGLVSGRSWWVVTPPGERDQIMRTTSFAFTLDGASGADRQLYRRVGPPAA